VLGWVLVCYHYLMVTRGISPGLDVNKNNNSKDQGSGDKVHVDDPTEFEPIRPHIDPEELGEALSRAMIPKPKAISTGTDHSGNAASGSIYDDLKGLFELGHSNPDAFLLQLNASLTRIAAGNGQGQACTFGTIFSNDCYASCPIDSQRFDYPLYSKANQSNADRFRSGDPEAFVFFQHLRKAGGTAFCDLAQHNMPRRQVPGYYCMPDFRGSLATPPWNNQTHLLIEMRKKGHRVCANEWDVFYSRFVEYPGIVLSTTFRDPVDRWYSQYRFEHLEHRDGQPKDAPRKPFITYYNNNKGWMEGKNYYVRTFEGEEDPRPPANIGEFYWTYRKYNQRPVSWQAMVDAVANLRKFHVLMVLDWMDKPQTLDLLKRELGWTSPPKQVLPHEVQAVRQVKTSTKAIDSMPIQDFVFTQKENIFDLLLFEVVKHIYIERAFCDEGK